MFIFLSKFLPLFFYPLGLIAILIILALAFRPKPRLQKWSLMAAFVLLYAGGNRWTATYLAKSLEWQYLPQENLPQAEVIVALGGATESLDYPRPMVEVNGAGDRVIYAAQLYKQGKAPHILVSGGNIDWLAKRAMTPAAEMAGLLKLMGVPDEAVWLQPESRNTYEDAIFSKKILDEKGITRVLLVTSAMHMPRAMGIFTRQGIHAIPAPVDYTVTQSTLDDLTRPDWQNQLVGLIPSAANLNLTTNVLKEYLGILIYRLRGWI